MDIRTRKNSESSTKAPPREYQENVVVLIQASVKILFVDHYRWTASGSGSTSKCRSQGDQSLGTVKFLADIKFPNISKSSGFSRQLVTPRSSQGLFLCTKANLFQKFHENPSTSNFLK